MTRVMMSSGRLRRSLARTLLLGATLVVAAGTVAVAQASLPETPVKLEVTDERALVWQLELAAGDLLHLRLEQLDVDVAIELIGPRGDELRRDDAIRRPFGHETLWWVTTVTGLHQVRLTTAGAGAILLKSAEARPASGVDQRRTRAEHLLADGIGSRRGNQEELEHGLTDLETARILFTELGINARVCHCLRYEAQQLRRLGRLTDAQPRLERCIALAEAQNLPDHLAAAWLDLSALAHARGDYAAALTAAKTALATAESADLTRQIADARINIALYLANLGRRRQALPVQRDIVTDARGRGDRKGLAYALVNLGANHYSLGDNAHAMEAFREARDLLLELDLKRQAALVLSNLGTVLAILGDVEAARIQNVRALAIRQELGDRAGQAASLVNIADGYRQLNQQEASETPYRRAIELYVAVENRWGEGFARAQLGEVLAELGRFQEAEQPLRQALAIGRELGHRDTEAEALASLARLADEAGDLPTAHRLLDEMVVAAQQYADPYREAEAHYLLARLATDDGRIADALAEIERAVELVESIRARAGGERLRASFLHLMRGYYDLWIDLLLRSGTTGSQQAKAFAVAERAKARGLLDLLAETRAGARLALDSETVDEALRLESEIRALQGRWREAEPADADTLQRELESALGELELARQTLRRNHPRYAEVFEPEPLDLAGTTALLDAETLLLEYHTGAERSWLFTVTHDGLTVHPLPGEAELAERVSALRELISRPSRRSEGRFAAAAGELWQLLLGPAATRIEGRPRLLIVADGPLRTLPFEILVDPRAETAASYTDMPFLIRSSEVAYAPSASVLASLTRLRPDNRQWDLDLVAYADPVPASPDRVATERTGIAAPDDLGRLFGSAEEAGAIAELFATDRHRLYTAEAALESRLKNDPDLGRTRYLHFATHGLVNAIVPAQSALLLSRADDGEDGLLQAFEIVGLKLSAELVTLSACETALGRLYRGEGLLGLARAFIYAGADRLLASLWRVSDTSTRELMTAFYSELRQAPANPAAALRRAKLRLIERPDRAHPYAWAPFVLLGG